MGANSLLYMNQSSPVVPFALNSMAESTSSHLTLRQPVGLSISMDCSQAVFISDEQLVVALRGGEIYSLTLLPDGLRGIRNILFEKTAAGVLPSCVRCAHTRMHTHAHTLSCAINLSSQICRVGAGHVFLGSRLGNSLLLSYSKKMVSDG